MQRLFDPLDEAANPRIGPVPGDYDLSFAERRLLAQPGLRQPFEGVQAKDPGFMAHVTRCTAWLTS